MPVQLTELAAKEVKHIIEQQHEQQRSKVATPGNGSDGSPKEPAPLYLRVAIKGGGCSGFGYSLDLTETKTETDEEWEQHGVTVVCDPKSLLYLDGATIDFRDEIMGRGFVFSNPNATSTCGCGSSFSA